MMQGEVVATKNGKGYMYVSAYSFTYQNIIYGKMFKKSTDKQDY